MTPQRRAEILTKAVVDLSSLPDSNEFGAIAVLLDREADEAFVASNINCCPTCNVLALFESAEKLIEMTPRVIPIAEIQQENKIARQN